MRKEQVAYRILLDRELGFEVDPIEVIPTIPGWTDRAYEKTYLKGELVDLVDRLRALDPRHRFDPNFLPSSLSTSRECLLTDRQMENMLVIYQNYSVFRSENQRRAAEALRNYLQMKKDYEKKLVHNNIMVDEITAVREKIRELRKQAKEDMYFMNFLVNFKLYKEIPVVQEIIETIPTPELAIIDESAKRKEAEIQKYKSLYEENLEEKEYFHQYLEYLEGKLKEAHYRIVNAERLCMYNVESFRYLEHRTEIEIDFMYEPKRPPVEKEKFDFKQIYWGLSGQLLAALNENSFIRKFMLTNVLPKEKDFIYLRNSLEIKADEYRKIVEEATPKPPPVQPEPVATPPTKGKKKKKK
ncbi:uncharacterized protein TNIN_154681 [Trichonephila inaurata madagascariensis]|uniref:Uncharacterized protein n=1 Tax=Trichonephila inaurata madagascariensis TaxID=2747483 RepID=A0A8X6YJR8_9ARAC|nr:uncharacterized protein TNIN_154681 [Trichonephila inaurata madagascariensis]